MKIVSFFLTSKTKEFSVGFSNIFYQALLLLLSMIKAKHQPFNQTSEHSMIGNNNYTTTISIHTYIHTHVHNKKLITIKD